MKKAMLVAMFVLAVAGFVMAQNWSSTVDVLGAHNNQGRGCAGCHAPHSGAFGSGHVPKNGGTDTGSYALWGQDASPLYGDTLAFGDSGRYVEVLPSTISTGSTEVGGILLCLSCHDGNITYNNMMTNQAYEQKIGLITNTTYGSSPIPTLLGNDGSYAGNYTNDHPVGINANISPGSGLVWNTSNNTFTVTPGTQYAQFVANYGWPSLAPGVWSNPYGVNGSGKPYVVCTTCHNQHVMTVYTATASSQIQGNSSGWYATYFFVNGPYNPNLQTYANNKAPSTTEFCRQCHFGESNEANNTENILAQFQ